MMTLFYPLIDVSCIYVYILPKPTFFQFDRNVLILLSKEYI